MFSLLLKKINERISFMEKERLWAKYREFDIYEPDVVVHAAKSIHIEKKLPSEPPEGITYHFCATGYMTENRDPDYCVIYREWRDVHYGHNSYCHWTLTEVPLICLALESNAKIVVIPDILLEGKTPFQKRWWQILRKKFPHKNIIPLSELPRGVKGILPLNHDTSSSKRLIGKCAYKYYHQGRATPYCIEISSELRDEFSLDKNLDIPRFYIERKTRRLKNEKEVQDYLAGIGFQILDLENYSLDQQATLFLKAKHIIGFHGAGLANLFFSTSETCVLEIVDSDCVYPSYKDGVVVSGYKATRTYYHMLSHMKRMDYSCVESVDYILDINKLENAINEKL